MPKTIDEIDIGDVEPADLIEHCHARGIFAWDLETTGLDPIQGDRIEGIAFYVPEDDSRNIPSLRAWYPFVNGTMRCHVKTEESPEEQFARIAYERALNEGAEQTKIDKLKSAWLVFDRKVVVQDLRPAMPQAETMNQLRPLFEQGRGTIAVAANVKFDLSFMRHASGCERDFWMDPDAVTRLAALADSDLQALIDSSRGLANWGFPDSCRLADSMLADFLCDENLFAYGLKKRTKDLFGHDMTTYTDVVKSRNQQVFGWMADELKADALGTYAMADCYWTWKIFENRMVELNKLTPGKPITGMTDVDLGSISPYDQNRTMGQLERIFWGVDMKIALILEEMESRGCLIDWRHLKGVTTRLQKEKEEILSKIEKQVGWTLNPNSTPQVSALLFAAKPNGLGLPTKGIKQGKSGEYSTGSKDIAHLSRVQPIVKDILDWRSADTIVGNFSDKLTKLSIKDEDNRIYSHFNQTGTKIFRLSCVSASTILETSVGLVKISELDLNSGAIYQIRTHKLRLRPITDLICKGEDELFEVTRRGGQSIECTKDHKFLTISGWRKLGEVGVGDSVLDQNLRAHPIVSIKSIGLGAVWDITVADDESYVAHGFVNHNSSNPVNLQNQPRDQNLIRKAFCAHFEDDPNPELLLFGADYSQVELRVAAFLSGDHGMVEVYSTGKPCTRGVIIGSACERYRWWECGSKVEKDNKLEKCGHTWVPQYWDPAHLTFREEDGHKVVFDSTGKKMVCPSCNGIKIEHQGQCRHVDLHQRTAEDVNCPRNPLAKNCNFGNLYRIGAPRFCQYADLYDEEGEPQLEYAQTVIDAWYDAYPLIRPFQEQTEFNLKNKSNWIAYTITGRARRLGRERYKNEYRAITQGIQFQVSGCVMPETPILTEAGYVPINRLAESNLSIFDGVGFTTDYSVFETGEKEVFEVRLSDGRTLKCSGDHRLAGMDGLEMSWPKVKELKEGDLVATHDVLAPQGDLDHGVSPNEAYLVGALIGDGYYGDSRGFTLAASAKDPGWPESLDASVQAAFGPWVKERMRWGIRKTSRNGLVKDLVVLSSRARSSLMILGLGCVSKQKKRIPDWVYTAPPDVRGACLAGLVDTDGSVLSYKQGDCTTLTVNYTSRVKHLVEGAWRLASSLGIDAALRTLDVERTSKKGGRTKHYRLDITYRGMQAFRRWVPLRHPRKAATLEGALVLIAQKPPRRKLPTTFVQAVAALADAAPIMVSRQGRTLPFTTDRSLRRKVQSYVGHARSGNAGENMVATILDYIDVPGAKEALQLGWVAIESIRSLGTQPTYDIEIHGENHAYIANGLLTHNSAQDILKVAMLRIWEAKNKKVVNSRPAESRLWKKFRQIIQVHDEVMCEGPRKLKDEIVEIMTYEMENAADLTRTRPDGSTYHVPLKTDVVFGRTWDDVH